MADNCSSFEAPWAFQPAFPDFSVDVSSFSRAETETLTRALQMSLSTEVDVLASVVAGGGPPLMLTKPEPAASLSASDAETSVTRQLGRSSLHVLSSPGGKIAKRKSRASKRSTTTYITADPANFRQMVQQVTGIRFAGPREAEADAVLKPEPHRVGGGGGAVLPAPLQGSSLPTLDTSSFLLDRAAAWTPAPSPPSRGSSFGSPALETAMFDVDPPPFPCFPTLESWGVM